MTILLPHAERTGLSPDEIVRRARILRRRAPFPMTLQDAVHAIIDAAIEHAQ